MFAAGIAIMAGVPVARAQSVDSAYAFDNLPPDARFKTDILLVVAHPDDETLVAGFLAREIEDLHKRVAVVFATHGSAGGDSVGPEQGDAHGDIREIEARASLASLGVTHVWFLTGKDTPGQNPLQSLGAWGHGECLDRLVSLVRLTRPTVILTWLPDFVTGENHGDHQATGILATEAFDLAGDPAAFSEQVAPARDGSYNPTHTDGLQPWQPEKLYFFDNSYDPLGKGWGPAYSSTEISPSRHISYGMIAAQAFTYHQTQGGHDVAALIKNGTLGSAQYPQSFLAPVQLILGKSLVKASVTGDVFAGVVPDGIPEEPPIETGAPVVQDAVLRIGDPWAFYHLFWRAHGLDRLRNLVPVEISVQVGGILRIPLIVENPGERALDINFSVQAPSGWKVQAVQTVHAGADSRQYLEVVAVAPGKKIAGWQVIVVSGETAGRNIGTVSVHAELGTGAF